MFERPMWSKVDIRLRLFLHRIEANGLYNMTDRSVGHMLVNLYKGSLNWSGL